MLVLWIVRSFEPDVWVAGHGFAPIRQAMTLFTYCLGLAWLFGARHRRWYWPFLIFLVAAIVNLPFTVNNGFAREMIRGTLLHQYLITVVALAYVRRVDDVAFLVTLYLLQCLWWAAQGTFTGGVVGWHPDYGNEDSFGPLMVVSFPVCLFLGAGAREKRIKLLALGTAGLCVFGVVASAARGAFLGLLAVLVYMWVRSTRKVRTLAYGIVATVLMVVAARVFFPDGSFWTEMATITEEGKDQGTGKDRWDLMTMAWHVFQQRPILGAGANNFGVYAFTHLPKEQLLAEYARNPGAIWGRGLHNIHAQVLSEFGLVGSLAFLWMLVDFWRKNRRLRLPKARAVWDAQRRRPFDISMVSVGLEAGMVAFLVTGFFYNQLTVSWMYILLGLNLLAYEVTCGRPSTAPRTRARDRWPGGAPSPPAAAPAQPVIPARAALQWPDDLSRPSET